MQAKRLAIIVSTLMLVAACGGGTSSTTKQGGTLRIAIGAEPGSPDPILQTSDQAGNIVYEYAETLTSAYNAAGQVKPLLATSWTASTDGLSYTFKLRQGIKFTDGTDFNAQAVKVNIDRLTDTSLTVPLRGQASDIKSTTVVDNYTVSFQLNQPLGFFPSILSVYPAAILSPASIISGANTYKNVVKPVGTGPYIFKEYAKAGHVLLTRNDNYWGQKANYKEQEWLVVPEPASREALIRSGGADIIVTPPPADIPALQSDSSLTVLTGKGVRTIFLGINMVGAHQPLLKDVRVRQALNYAIDKQSIIKSVIFGLGDAEDSPAPQPLAGHCSAGSYGYDPAKAKQLLQAAGASGMTVKFGSPNGRYIADLQAAQAIAGNLRDVGLNVQGPSSMDFPTYLNTLFVPPAQATFDLAYLGLSVNYPDIGQQMDNFITSQITPNGLNFMGYSNTQVDDLVSKADISTDQSFRAQNYCQAQKLVWNDAPWVFLWTQRVPVVYTNHVKGVVALPSEQIYADQAQPS
jgi:peptide/nickel transport system substrate-binding protein